MSKQKRKTKALKSAAAAPVQQALREEAFKKFFVPLPPVVAAAVLLFAVSCMIWTEGSFFTVIMAVVVTFAGFFYLVPFTVFSDFIRRFSTIIEWACGLEWLKAEQRLRSSINFKDFVASFKLYLRYSRMNKKREVLSVSLLVSAVKYFLLFAFVPRNTNTKWARLFREILKSRWEELLRSIKEAFAKFFHSESEKRIIEWLPATLLLLIVKEPPKKIDRILRFSAFEKNNLSSAG